MRTKNHGEAGGQKWYHRAEDRGTYLGESLRLCTVQGIQHMHISPVGSENEEFGANCHAGCVVILQNLSNAGAKPMVLELGFIIAFL